MPDPASLRCQVVVIGSGAGGGPAAAALAEAGLDVVVLEAGPRLTARDFSDDELEMRRRLGTAVPTADAGYSFYGGACAGGSTVINDALCWRTPPEILADWRETHGLGDLRDEAFAPFVERAWGDVHAEPTRRSHINRNAHFLAVGARRLGWAATAVPRNVRGCARLGRCNMGCPVDAKQSTLVSYLPRAERAGARIVASARATRLRVEAGAVVGVEARRVDPETGRVTGELRVDAPIAVLAAGVMGSAPLLLRSGIPGRGATAGRGLQVHSTAYVCARFEEPVHGYYGPTMAVAVEEFGDVNGRSGPGFMLENASVHPVIDATVLPDFGAPHERAMRALPHLANTVVVARDRTRGAIRVDGDGRASFHYPVIRQDLERLRQAFDRGARAYLAAGAAEVYLPLHGYGPVRDEGGLARLADAPLDPSRLSLLYSVHLFGGAAMGGSPDTAFCRPDGACWDVRGLYVSDASALPSNTGVNPQITVMANALRVAEGIAATGGRA